MTDDSMETVMSDQRLSVSDDEADACLSLAKSAVAIAVQTHNALCRIVGTDLAYFIQMHHYSVIIIHTTV